MLPRAGRRSRGKCRRQGQEEHSWNSCQQRKRRVHLCGSPSRRPRVETKSRGGGVQGPPHPPPWAVVPGQPQSDGPGWTLVNSHSQQPRGRFQEGHTEQSPGRGSRHPRVQGTSVTPSQIISSLCPTLHPESHFHCVFFRFLGFCANGGFFRPLGYPQKLACSLFWRYPPPIYFRGNSGTCDKEGILAGHRPGFSGRGAMMGERGGESRASIFLQRNKLNQISIQIRHWSSFDNIPNSCKQGSLDN